MGEVKTAGVVAGVDNATNQLPNNFDIYRQERRSSIGSQLASFMDESRDRDAPLSDREVLKNFRSHLDFLAREEKHPSSIFTQELSTLANSPQLRKELFDGKAIITRDKLAMKLALDSMARDAEVPGLLPNKQVLSGEERHALEYLNKNWDDLQTDHLTVDGLNHFQSEKLGERILERFDSCNSNAVTIDDTRRIAEGLVDELKDEHHQSLRLQEDLETSNTQVSRLQPQEKIEKAELQEYREVAFSMFYQLDTDNDGFLSKEELAQAIEDPKYKGKQAQVLVGLYKHISEIEEISNDEYGREDNGISIEDLQLYGLAANALHGDLLYGLSAQDLLKKEFQHLDRDQDGYVTLDEIKEELRIAGNLPQDRFERRAALLCYLIQNYQRFEDTHNDEWGNETSGITREDVDGYKVVNSNQISKTVLETYAHGSRVYDMQHKQVSHQLYADPNNPLNSITPEAVRQGTIGDCYLLASIAAVAKTRPELILKMIKDNGNGTYTVFFPGDPGHPVTVNAPTVGEMGLFNGGSEHGTWACILEKAYGKYKQEANNIFNKKLPTEGADGGGFPENTNTLLTGKYEDTAWLSSYDREYIKQFLIRRLTSKNLTPVTAVIYQTEESVQAGETKTKDGFYRGHAYTILDFDPNGSDGGTITIRNPWGMGKNCPEGTISISLKTFIENFSSVQ